MHPRDESKIAFMSEFASYCYKVMPFSLKNVGATYQRLMDRILAPMLGRNVQAYVDDMVVTSEEKDQHIADLEELFTTIAKYNLKLNLEKCAQGEVEKFLGFLLPESGIEAFTKLKEYLASPPVLGKSLPGSPHSSLFCNHRSGNQLGHY